MSAVPPRRTPGPRGGTGRSAEGRVRRASCPYGYEPAEHRNDVRAKRGCSHRPPGETSGPTGRAVLRGDVVPLPMPLTPGGSLTALYAAMPICFDDAFFSVTLENGTHVSLVWLVPLHAIEAEYVEKHGWPDFESELTKQDPDLFDLRRPQTSL
ncbi:suppressor of fused domain protein [Streptomyces sp. NPDC048211]|uniref:suppressor of fused domain protein n=1 Tax=Streptomyces sp. NPDC048211 TaxID=3365516 RepID=UPI0037150722